MRIKNHLNESNKKYNTNKQHWGLVDGVGFCENKKDTIDKTLTEFDCFVQLKSIYKVGLQLHKLKLIKIKAISFDMMFYSFSEANEMYLKYGSNDIISITDNSVYKNSKEIKAGKAKLYI